MDAFNYIEKYINIEDVKKYFEKCSEVEGFSKEITKIIDSNNPLDRLLNIYLERESIYNSNTDMPKCIFDGVHNFNNKLLYTIPKVIFKDNIKCSYNDFANFGEQLSFMDETSYELLKEYIGDVLKHVEEGIDSTDLDLIQIKDHFETIFIRSNSKFKKIKDDSDDDSDKYEFEIVTRIQPSVVEKYSKLLNILSYLLNYRDEFESKIRSIDQNIDKKYGYKKYDDYSILSDALKDFLNLINLRTINY